MGLISHSGAMLLLVLFVLVFCVGDGVYAFGAGNIPSFAYMEGRAFRHGDIEDILAEIAKKAGGGLGGMLASVTGGKKFGGLDIKRVYFGNWLRDYSQAVDVASLKKLPLQNIINICMALGFLAHGYATGEFQVTAERLGTYLPTEHIDNPKGYADGEDARKYHPGLRPPVDPRELEVDTRTGMKNYIANESGNWDTSKALVRRTLMRCIEIGRRSRSSRNVEDEYEAYRLLGQALHTLEDYPAHSNFCELALVNMGHQQVFTHVGDQVRIHAPNGRSVAPIVTGTFGSSDFIHSLLGEATDHLSEASVSDLTKEIDKAKGQRSRGVGDSPGIRQLFSSVPGLSNSDMSRSMDGIEQISRSGQPGQGGKRPEDMSPEELYQNMWKILVFRDNIMRSIETTIEKIPGLSSLVEKITNSISVFVFTSIEPFLKPILQSATTGLSQGSAEVINNQDQYEVFNVPHASDPTHSFLSKDHFGLILNEPAGRLAQIIVRHTVTLVVQAWDNQSMNPHDSIEQVLECLFHPDFHTSGSTIQSEMMGFMKEWANSHGGQQRQVMDKLSKDSVRNHRNTRIKESGDPGYVGGPGHNYGIEAQNKIQGYVGQIPGVSQAQQFLGNFNNSGGPGGGYRRDLDGPSPPFNPSGPPPVPQSSYPGMSGGPPAGPGGGYYGNAPPSSYPGGPSPSPYSPPPGGPPSHSSYPGGPQSTYPGGPPHSAYEGGGSSFPSAGGPPSFPTAGGGHSKKKSKGGNDSDDSGESDDSKDGRYGAETKEQRKARKKAKKEAKKAAKHGGQQGHPPSFPSMPPQGGYAPPSGSPPPSGYPPYGQQPPAPHYNPPSWPPQGPPSQYPGGPNQYNNYGPPPPGPPPGQQGWQQPPPWQ